MIYIGTSGYSYKDWIGPFYPPAIKDVDMFPYYCKNFNFTEINSTYYHMPSTRLFDSINRKSDDDFKLSVKLFGGFTHERSSGSSEAVKFMDSLKPVTESGKLVCLVAQYPYSFHHTDENMDHVKSLRNWFGDTEVNVEFRNREWIKRDTLAQLAEAKLGFVCVDEPDIRGLVTKTAAATTGVAYVRMHGRNAAKWYGGESSQRYDYLYAEDELDEWVPKIKSLDMNARVTLISFNNHPIGKAVENARMMRKMLGLE